MKKSIVAALVIVSFSAFSHAESKDSSYLFAKSMWSIFDWASFRKHKIMKEIPDRDVPEISKDGKTKWIKKRDIKINNIEGYDQVQILESGKGSNYRYIITLNAEADDPFLCSKMSKELQREYGPPDEKLDLGYKSRVKVDTKSDVTFDAETIRYVAQWGIGNSSITQSCIGWNYEYSGSTETVLFIFENQKHAKKVKALTWIECVTEIFSHTNTESKREGEQLFIIGIDDYHGRIVRRDKSIYGSVIEFSDSIIISKVETEKTNSQIEIDRVIGVFEMKTTHAKDNSFYIIFKGPCTKTDINKKRF